MIGCSISLRRRDSGDTAEGSDKFLMNLDEYKRYIAPSEEEKLMLFRAWCHFMVHIYPEMELMFQIPSYPVSFSSDPSNCRKFRQGVPNFCLPVRSLNSNALFIDILKSGEIPSEDKLIWRKNLRKGRNYAVICNGTEIAQKVIEAYLAEDKEMLLKFYDEDIVCL